MPVYASLISTNGTPYSGAPNLGADSTSLQASCLQSKNREPVRLRASCSTSCFHKRWQRIAPEFYEDARQTNSTIYWSAPQPSTNKIFGKRENDCGLLDLLGDRQQDARGWMAHLSVVSIPSSLVNPLRTLTKRSVLTSVLRTLEHFSVTAPRRSG